MSKIREKLNLLHKPLETSHPEVENFPVDKDSSAATEHSEDGDADQLGPREPSSEADGSARAAQPHENSSSASNSSSERRSATRRKLDLLHQPLSKARPEVENFPSEQTSANERSKPRRKLRTKWKRSRSVDVEPTSTSPALKARMDRLMKVVQRERHTQSRQATTQTPRSTGHADQSTHRSRKRTYAGREVGRAGSTRGSEQSTAKTWQSTKAEPPVQTSGGFTLSQRAFERWRKEKLHAEKMSPIVKRKKLHAIPDARERRGGAENSGCSSRNSRSDIHQPPIQPTVDRDPRNLTDRANTASAADEEHQNSGSPRATESAQANVMFSGDSRGDRLYLDTIKKLGRLETEDGIRRVLDAVEAGLSEKVRGHAFRTLARLAEDGGFTQHAIVAYDALSDINPTDPFAHRELARLYQQVPANRRRAHHHLKHAVALAPWDGELASSLASLEDQLDESGNLFDA